MQKKISSLVRTSTLLGVAGVMVTSIGAPASAASGIQAYGFHIDRTASCQYRVEGSTHIPMSLEDAQGYLANGARVKFEIYGQDTWSDDFRATFTPFTTTAELNGIFSSFRVEGVGCSVLDEDWKDVDEIYFKAKFIDGDGRTIAANSSVIRGDFHL